MRKLFTGILIFVVLFLISVNNNLAQQAEMFQTYVVIDDGSGDDWYAGDKNADGAVQFDGLNLGTFSSTSSLIIRGGEIKTYKNSGGDVTGAFLYYRIYKSGSSAGIFNELNLPYHSELGNGDQKWQKVDYNIDVLSQVNEQGTWVIEVYWKITTNLGDRYDSKNGANHKATFVADASLPVELTTFTAFAKGNEVIIEWETATEVNNYGFYVERLAKSLIGDNYKTQNNTNWKTIVFVEGHGNSNSPKTYSYSDNSANSGKYQYRLKQVDIDGSFEYSKTVEVNLEIPTEFELNQNYPNPFNPVTTIKYSIPDVEQLGNSFYKITLKVFDVLGQEVATLVNKEQRAGTYEIKFDASKLNSGIYIYSLQTSQKVINRKMILMK